MTPGEENNNPGSIREMPSERTLWLGERADADDRMKKFETASDGLQRLAMLLLDYQRRGLYTIERIIGRWAAPPDENDVEAYIAAVCNRTNRDRKELLNLAQDRRTFLLLIVAIIQQENGRCIYLNRSIADAIDKVVPRC